VPAPSRIPLWLKLAWTAWVAVWVPFYWSYYGPQNFLWFCDMANFGVLAALWAESSLLISWQAVSVLLVQTVWTVDVIGRTLIGSKFLGTAEYMWNPGIPLVTRVLSLFHLAMPPILLWGVWRLGYDRRAWLCQSVWSWVILPLCYFGWGAKPGFEGGINWVVGPFDQPQTRMAPLLYLGFCMVAYPVLLYAPTHLALRFLFRRREATASGL
jgi:hypothetical protein